MEFVILLSILCSILICLSLVVLRLSWLLGLLRWILMLCDLISSVVLGRLVIVIRLCSEWLFIRVMCV